MYIYNYFMFQIFNRVIITEGRETGPSSIGSSNNYILSTLSLNSARVEHGGRYECRATNSHGSIAHAARLNVYGTFFILYGGFL